MQLPPVTDKDARERVLMALADVANGSRLSPLLDHMKAERDRLTKTALATSGDAHFRDCGRILELTEFIELAEDAANRLRRVGQR